MYLPFNEITTMASLMFLTNLEIIDLESNFIDGISELDYLSILSNVKLLNLQNNPVCELENYETKVRGHLPQLQILDDYTAQYSGSNSSSRSVSPNRRNQHKQPPKNHLKAQVLNLEADVIKVQELMIDNSKNSGSQFFPPIEPNNMLHNRPRTAIGGNSTRYGSPGSRPGTAKQRNELRQSMNSDYSAMTEGEVMAGSFANSIRARRKREKAYESSPTKGGL